jgi:hypothetical protein
MKTFSQFQEDLGRRKQYEQERRERRRIPAVKSTDRDLAKLTYMLNIDRPGK